MNKDYAFYCAKVCYWNRKLKEIKEMISAVYSQDQYNTIDENEYTTSNLIVNDYRKLVKIRQEWYEDSRGECQYVDKIPTEEVLDYMEEKNIFESSREVFNDLLLLWGIKKEVKIQLGNAKRNVSIAGSNILKMDSTLGDFILDQSGIERPTNIIVKNNDDVSDNIPF